MLAIVTFVLCGKHRAKRLSHYMKSDATLCLLMLDHMVLLGDLPYLTRSIYPFTSSNTTRLLPSRYAHPFYVLLPHPIYRESLTHFGQIDFTKLAGLAGHTNPRSTANAFANIRKKLAKIAEANGESAPTSPTKATPKKAPATPGKSKGKASATGDVEDAGGSNVKETAVRNTPKRGGGVKRKYTETGSDDDVIKEESESDGDDDAGPKTPEPTAGAKVKGKKEGVGKSPAKSPAKRKVAAHGTAPKKLKIESEEDNGEEDGDEGDGSKEYTEEQAVKDEVEEGGEE